MPHNVLAGQLPDFRLDRDLERDATGAPFLPPQLVLHQGPDVHIIDLRPPSDASGVLGQIPGSVFISPERLEARAGEIPSETPIVLVSRTGRRASAVALRLEQAGLRRVVALGGGIAQWRRLGFGTSRGPAATAEVLRASQTVDGAALLTLDGLRDHVGPPSRVRWVKLAAMATFGSFSCIDGRDDRGVIGTPGGDAGEFLAALAAAEQVRGVELDDDAVRCALLVRIDTFGDFCRHTDSDTFQALAVRLRADARIGDVIGSTEAEMYAFLRQPPAALHEALLEHLVHPDDMGCGHVRMMLAHPGDYGIRRGLVESFLRAFYRLWWAGAPELHLTLLPGGHNEAAVVNVRLSENLWSMSHVPLVAPTCAGRQVFVNHPEVASYLRGKVVELYRRGFGPVAIDDPAAFRTVLEDLAARQLTQTVGHLASGLPIYDVVFGADGTYEVRESG